MVGGVSGSSPEEGSAEAPEIGAFCFAGACTISGVRVGMENLFMEPSGREGASEKAKTGRFATPVPLPVLRKGVGEPPARHRAMVEWATWLLTHKRITQRALLPGAVLTTVGWSP
jgi:hypothetical protein